MIRFSCPACGTVMMATANEAGQKIACLECGQRLQIPPGPNKTVLALPEAPLAQVVYVQSRPAHDEDRPARRRAFQCPYCGTDEPPLVGTRMTGAGWVTFALLLLFCLPLFWIGFLVREDYRYCADCGTRFD